MNANIKKHTDTEISGTDAEKGKKIEFRQMEVEQFDNDGENEKPTPDQRTSICQTAMIIAKTIIGSGLLNMSYNFRTLGILGALAATLLCNIISYISCYLLLKCKETTQRYGYSKYSKLALGFKGTFITKFSIGFTMLFVTSVYFIIISDSLKSLLLLFFNESFFTSKNMIIILLALIVSPLIFKKDFSALNKWAILAMYNIYLFVIILTIIFFIRKSKNQLNGFDSLNGTFDTRLLYPSGTLAEIFQCATSYVTSFCFQVNLFPIYLLLTPRSSKNMLKAVTIGTSICSILYTACGILGLCIYGNKINDSILIFFRKDFLILKDTDKIQTSLIMFIFVINFLSTFISIPLIFFPGKTHIINTIYLVNNKLEKKNINHEGEDNKIELVKNIDSVRKISDINVIKADVINENKDATKMEESNKNIIASILYLLTILVAMFATKISVLDSFLGVTTINYIVFLAPSIFFLILCKDYMNSCQKIGAYFLFIFGICLFIGFVVKNILLLIYG